MFFVVLQLIDMMRLCGFEFVYGLLLFLLFCVMLVMIVMIFVFLDLILLLSLLVWQDFLYFEIVLQVIVLFDDEVMKCGRSICIFCELVVDEFQ